MSKWIEDSADGNYIISDIDMYGCKYDINEVCCNADCDEMLADFIDAEDCAGCKYFTQEDGKF